MRRAQGLGGLAAVALIAGCILSGCGSNSEAGAFFPGNGTPSPAALQQQATPRPTATPVPGE